MVNQNSKLGGGGGGKVVLHYINKIPLRGPANSKRSSVNAHNGGPCLDV